MVLQHLHQDNFQQNFAPESVAVFHAKNEVGPGHKHRKRDMNNQDISAKLVTTRYACSTAFKSNM